MIPGLSPFLPMFSALTNEFLLSLAENNSREWFQQQKTTFEASKKEAEEAAEALLLLLKRHDDIATDSGKKALYRIYRDVRFSKDKSPYKTHWAGGYRRATHALRGGYYWQVKPGATILAGGFFSPSKEDLLHIRQQIAQDAAPLRDVLAEKDFQDTFGGFQGQPLKTAPKGFPKDHPEIDLLRFKSFYVEHSVPDAIAFSTDFPAYADGVFQRLRPFFDYMSEILTTDLNGESLI